MKAMMRQMARESHLDVYGLGLDKEKWEEALSRYTELVIKECADHILNTSDRYRKEYFAGKVMELVR